MERLVWIGPAYAAQDHKSIFSAQGFDVVEFTSAEAALAATDGLPLAAVIVAADWADAPAAIATMLSVRPDLKILAATKLGMPSHVRLCIEAGANHLIDLKEGSQETALLLRRAVAEHQKAVRQRELLLKLRDLNEDFLRAMVRETKRNFELESVLLREEEAELGDPEKARVMVVDDELSITELLAMVIEPLGCSVVTHTDPRVAFEQLKREAFDLLICDKNMPGIDGLELLRRAKVHRPGIGTILITGFASKESAVEALQSGANAYLEKPFENIDDVFRLVSAVLAKQKDERKKRDYLHQFKERNRAFLEQYKTIRAELEQWLSGGRGGVGEDEGEQG